MPGRVNPQLPPAPSRISLPFNTSSLLVPTRTSLHSEHQGGAGMCYARIHPRQESQVSMYTGLRALRSYH